MSDEKILSFIPEEDFVLSSGVRLDPRALLADVHKAREDGFFSSDTGVA
ncbi:MULTISPECIES: hypothetical protein [unclassified Bradyrhizobium]|nr:MULTISPECIES: hypothetical protein [unclassified Bradyrhizobium]MCP3464078.1 hypothetical protein [Bradyrhizobium sp. CCGUVB23]